MKKKELISALGLSISLAVTACGTTAPQYEQAEEVTEVIKEEPTPTPVPVEEEKEVEEVSEEVSENSTESDTTEQAETIEEPEEAEYVIENIEPVAVMYATQQSNVRDFPCIDGSKVIGTLSVGQAISVIGKTVYKDKTWYLLQNDNENPDEKRFVSGSLLSESKPNSGKTGDKKSIGNTGTTNPAPAPQPSDCAVADCDWGDCEGDCSADCGNGWAADCGFGYCSASYCAEAE